MKMIDNWIDKIIRLLWYPISILSRKKLREEWLITIRQFVKFGIVGVSNTTLSYLIYIGVLMILKRLEVLLNLDYFVAQFAGFFISVLWSFWCNNRYVFNDKSGSHHSMLESLFKTFMSYVFTGLLLSSFLLWMWVDVFNISEFAAPLINLLITVPLNFLLNKFWAFKK